MTAWAQPNIVMLNVTPAEFNGAETHFEPIAPDLEVGVPKSRPQWGTLVSASADISWTVQYIWDCENAAGSADWTVGIGNPDSGPSTVAVGTGNAAFPGGNANGSIHQSNKYTGAYLDSPAAGYGLNDIQPWSTLSVGLQCQNPSLPASGTIEGFYTGFYEVTYIY